MALLQIAEPGQSTAPHQHRLAAGIDLGTTNSLIATVRSGLPDTLPNDGGEHLLPSVVHVTADGEFSVGRSALQYAGTDPDNTIISVKRLMGRGLEDMSAISNFSANQLVDSDSGMPSIRTAAGDLSPVQVSAEILRKLADRAEQALGGDLTGVVITVPAYFDEAQRQATKDAATLAGLKVLRLINEPTAAAVAYGLDSGEQGLHAIFDLGGGTFDISILRLTKGVFEVVATGGDSALGGDDMDRLLADWICAQAGLERSDKRLMAEVLTIARGVKEQLTEHNEAEVALGDRWQGSISRSEFEQLVSPLVERCLLACRRTLRDAGLKPSEIEQIVMVGGSTRVPRIREAVAEFFGRPPLTSIDPDRVVAIGTAVQANILAGNKPDADMLLLDVIPLSLGVETMGGLVEKIIDRNTTIPISRAQEFTTYKDGQTAMAIHVVQGERELVDDCRSLARFELRGIPPMVAGAARIRVTYQVDSDGLLGVTAEEVSSGVKSTIQVKPSYGLSDEQISGMLKSSIEHAREDVSARMLREQQVDAARAHEAVTAALAENGEQLLSREEIRRIEAALDSLDQAATSSDPELIKQAITAVDNLTQDFAARRMDASIAKALVGQELDEI